MSSAILYAAIIGIWALLLVPRWLWRPHFAGREAGELVEADEPDEMAADQAGQDQAADQSADQEAGDHAAPDEAPRTYATPDLTADKEAESTARSARGHQPVWAVPPVGWAAPPPRDAEPAWAPKPPRDAEPAWAPNPPRDAEPAWAPKPPRAAEPARRTAPVPLTRTRALKARRWLLVTLVGLGAATGACTYLKLTSWWVCVPPAALLGMYLLLLRAAAAADAEQARRPQARPAPQRRDRAAPKYERPVVAAEPAQVISISEHLDDQLYDQYADATIRAVGD